MLHACVQKFDMTKNFEIFLGSKHDLNRHCLDWMHFELQTLHAYTDTVTGKHCGMLCMCIHCRALLELHPANSPKQNRSRLIER